MTDALACSLALHALLLLAAAGVAGVAQTVAVPRVAIVSIAGEATPPGAAAISPPEPILLDVPAEWTGVAAGPLSAAELVRPDPPADPAEPPPPLVEHDFTPAPRKPTTGAFERKAVAAPPAPLEQPEATPPATQAGGTPGPAATVVDSADCNEPPLMTQVAWPRAVRRLFIGTVTARVVVDAQGRLQSVELSEGTGNAAWDADLLAALRAATFKPATQNGKAITCRHNYRITFTDK